jgi:hypothetical protein
MIKVWIGSKLIRVGILTLYCRFTANIEAERFCCAAAPPVGAPRKSRTWSVATDPPLAAQLAGIAVPGFAGANQGQGAALLP